MLDSGELFPAEPHLPELEATTKTAWSRNSRHWPSALGWYDDKTWFVGALIERENMMPSAMRNGVAFLHTLYRNPERVVRPFMVLGRSQDGVDFDSLDGEPTHLFFVLGLKFQELELPWLSKLSQMCARARSTHGIDGRARLPQRFLQLCPTLSVICAASQDKKWRKSHHEAMAKD